MNKSVIDYLLYSLLLSDPAASADLAVVLMQEGLAHVLLVGKRYYDLSRDVIHKPLH